MKDKKDERQDEARQFDEAEGETVKSGEMTKEGGGREEREREESEAEENLDDRGRFILYVYANCSSLDRTEEEHYIFSVSSPIPLSAYLSGLTNRALYRRDSPIRPI